MQSIVEYRQKISNFFNINLCDISDFDYHDFSDTMFDIRKSWIIQDTRSKYDSTISAVKFDGEIFVCLYRMNYKFLRILKKYEHIYKVENSDSLTQLYSPALDYLEVLHQGNFSVLPKICNIFKMVNQTNRGTMLVDKINQKSSLPKFLRPFYYTLIDNFKKRLFQCLPHFDSNYVLVLTNNSLDYPEIDWSINGNVISAAGILKYWTILDKNAAIYIKMIAKNIDYSRIELHELS